MEPDLEAIDMAKCLMKLSETGEPTKKDQGYKCKTCQKSFSSFQALGGHRASHSQRGQAHKKRRSHDRVNDNSTNARAKSRSYKCLVCSSEFSSGQALGGHMRKHRPLVNFAELSNETESFDLNFPPLEESEENEGK